MEVGKNNSQKISGKTEAASLNRPLNSLYELDFLSP